MEMKSSELSLFLGPIGGPEMIVILVILLFMAATVLLVFYLVKTISKPKPPALPPQASPQEKLLSLDSLLKEKLISEAEYEQQRRAILENL